MFFAVVTISCNSGDAGIIPESRTSVKNDSLFLDRTYHIFVPESYTVQGDPAPLVFVFHGAGDTGINFENYSGLDNEALNFGAIVVYPDAKTANWNEGCDCNIASRLQIDDLGFVKFLVNKIKKEYKIDSSRIYAVGFSQGGLFAQYIACAASDLFAAVAIEAATFSVPLSENCFPKQSKNILMINGTTDHVLPYEGNLNDGKFSLLSANAAIKLWAAKNSCSSTPVVEYFQNSTGFKIRKEIYGNCRDAVEVVIYIVENGGHDWFLSPELYAPKVIMDFFKRH
ncbi:MAG: alpha/beta hydrolase-fold protein [Ignavibacteriales bacterium]|nr:alpha/beta hydrolase-fold protein [Ignavibacteriales bacterium]